MGWGGGGSQGGGGVSGSGAYTRPPTNGLLNEGAGIMVGQVGDKWPGLPLGPVPETT